MVSHQREAPAGKLYTDLVAAAGMKPDLYKAGFTGRQCGKFQTGFFDTLSFLPDDKNLVFCTVLKKKIFPVAGFRRSAMYYSNIFFYHGAFLNRFAQGGGRDFCPGVNHDTAYIFVQTVDGINLTTQKFFQSSGNFRFGVQPYRFDTDCKIPVGIENFHMYYLGICFVYYSTAGEKKQNNDAIGCNILKLMYNKQNRNGGRLMTTKDFQRKSPLMIFLSYFKNHKKLFAIDVSCAIGIAAIDLAFPLVTRHALYEMLPNQMYRTFFLVMAAVVACYVIRSVLNFTVAYLGHTFGIRVEADIRQDLFRHMQELSFDFYDQNRTGKLMSRLTSDLFELTELAHHGPEDLLTSVLTICGALAVMVSIRWQLAVIVALTIPVFLLVVMTMRRRMGQASKASKEKIAHINQEIESSLSGVRTAKAFANENVEAARFNAANDLFKTAKRNFHKAMGQFHSSVEFFLCSLNVIIIGVGGYYVMRGQMDYVDLLTFNLYIASFVSPMRKLSSFSEMFANGFAGLNRFMEVMRTEPTVQDKADAKALESVRGEITVENVSFAYDGDLAVLHNVSLKVQPGETVAIVGPSGGGKTTLCQLIPRFYDVSAGAIRLDGTDIRDLTQKSIHENIGIVQQDVFLFADTILENIRYGKPGATMEEVIEAAKKAEIYEDILSMPEGFNTYVGERGTLLSGGQKQRVAIARIFLKNPPVLILDEATSALDSVTEAKIQRAFDNLAVGRTTLIIAHRLSTIRNADRIISIADGVITESGSHAELVNTGGIYSQLYKTQNALALEAMK